MSNIEEDIKRCKKLTEPQNANWIGISNQLAIAHLIERIKELEEENKKKSIENICYQEELENSIPVQKVKDKVEDYTERKRYYDDNNIFKDEEYYKILGTIEVLEELLEEK